MIVRFDKKYLEELYLTGKCTDKKHRFQPDIVSRYALRVKQLYAAARIEELFAIHSLNYEVLSGDKDGVSSVRINRQYRLEFMVSVDETKEPVVTVCTITEISNHYQ